MKEKFIFFLFALTFFLNTQYNLFHLIPKDQFEYSQLEVSETLVIGKILNSEQGDIFEDGGFTGTYYFDKNSGGRAEAGNLSYQKYIHNEVPQKVGYNSYKSQIGGQAILYTLFDQVFGLDNNINIEIFRIFNSLLLSVLLALFVSWIQKKWGLSVAITTFLLLLPNFWLFLYGKSSWWCNWTYFLPFVYGLYYFENHKKTNFKKYTLVFSLLFFIKFWFNGFEFITVFLVASAIPYLYYNFENKLSFYLNFLVRHFIITISSLLLAIAFQLYQFYLLTGSFGDGIHHLVDAFSRRSSGGYHYLPTQTTLSTLKTLHLDIITRYLGNTFINDEILTVKLPFAAIIFLGIVCSLYLYKKQIETRLVAITWFSILAPFSWFILFKEHAHIHTHIDFFIWYCPFLVLLILLISLTINTLAKTSAQKAQT